MKRRLYLVLFLLIAASFIVNVPVQAKIGQEPAAEKAGSSISGTVYDADGVVMAGVTITLLEVQYKVYLPLLLNNAAASDKTQSDLAVNETAAVQADLYTVQTTTLANGTYSFTEVPEGTYRITPTTGDGKTFDPLYRMVSVPTDKTGQNFIQNDLVDIGEPMTFWMGCDPDHNDGFPCDDTYELPLHQVTISPFYIDRTEVTNYQYKQCVAAGVCDVPNSTESQTRLGTNAYYGNMTYDYYPVINVSWYDADTYCEWAGKRLPTEAEWELVARGGATSPRAYPWGDTSPTCDYANFYYYDDEYSMWTYCNSETNGDTDAVGLYPSGESPLGALDMAGNVKEWVADWYEYPGAPAYYSYSPPTDPHGPYDGDQKVIRGGSFFQTRQYILTAERHKLDPTKSDNQTGFRCVLPKN